MRGRRSDSNECYDVFECLLGVIYLVFGHSTLTGISFEKPRDISLRHTGLSEKVKEQLREYFEGRRKSFSFPADLSGGTDFERQVWNTLLEIPFGQTRTYKWVAERIGRPQAFRAVGSALGRNPLPIIYPCHRVIESDGALGGYTPSVDIKRRLLEMEYYTRRRTEDHQA